MPGIDQQVQQTVDQFRGNPQGLQKRYQQNQQLLDLLALQRLKSEKDAAARNMQLQMQTSPQTIKDQREQELLQRTKQEMAQQVGGVMQQQAQQQQKRAQAVGLGGLARAPQAGMPAPRPQGAPAPQGGAPMPKMAAGGIVALAKGGAVTDEELLQRLRFTNNLGSDSTIDRGILRAANGRLSKEDITPAMRLEFALQQAGPQARRAIENYKTEAPQQKAEDAAREAQSAAREEAGAQEFLSSIGVEPTEATGIATGSSPQPPAGDDTVMPQLLAGDDTVMAGDDAVVPDAPVPTAAGGGTDVVMPTAEGNQGLAAPKIVAQAPDYSKVGESAAALATQLGLDNLPTRESARDAARTDAEQYLDIQGDRAAYDALIADRERINKQMFNPTKDRNSQLIAMLAGAANTSSLGGAGRGMAQASLAARDAQDAARYAREIDLLGKREGGLDRLKEMRTTAFGAGQTGAEINAKERAAAAGLYAELNASERQSADTLVKNALSADIANLDAFIAQAKIESDNALRTAIENKGNKQALIALKGNLAESEAQFIAETLADDPIMQQMELTGQSDPVAAAAYAKARQAKAASLRQSYRRDMKAAYDLIDQELQALGVVNPMGSSGGDLDTSSLNVDPTDLRDLLAQYGN